MMKFLHISILTVFQWMSIVTCEWEEALEYHNQIRELHGAESLILDQELNESAQKCAEYLDDENEFNHVCNKYFGTSYGENLGAGHGTSAGPAMADASQDWYSEVNDYSFSSEEFSLNTGHFTQMVWKDTKRVGFGFANSNGNQITVAHYSPAGNVPGYFLTNVIEGNDAELDDDQEDEEDDEYED